MGAETGIAWCDHTHNEWIGCLKISAACASCYAEVSTPTRVVTMCEAEQRARGAGGGK